MHCQHVVRVFTDSNINISGQWHKNQNSAERKQKEERQGWFHDYISAYLCMYLNKWIKKSLVPPLAIGDSVSFLFLSQVSTKGPLRACRSNWDSPKTIQTRTQNIPSTTRTAERERVRMGRLGRTGENEDTGDDGLRWGGWCRRWFVTGDGWPPGESGRGCRIRRRQPGARDYGWMGADGQVFFFGGVG